MKKKNTTIQYARALRQLVTGLRGEKLSVALHEFASLLAKHHVLKKADKILQEFERFSKTEDGVVPITITTARELSDKDLIKIGNVFSENAEVTPVVDSRILGGFVAQSEEVIFDASLKKQLSRLKLKLTTNN